MWNCTGRRYRRHVADRKVPGSVTRCISGFFPRIYGWLLLQTRTARCSDSATQSSLAQSESTEIYYVNSSGCCFFFLCIGIFNNFKQISFSPIDYYNFIPFIPLLLFSVSSLWCHHAPWVDRSLRLLAGEAFPVMGKGAGCEIKRT